ncbi:nodulation protein NfeD [Spirochaetota bacterium]
MKIFLTVTVIFVLCTIVLFTDTIHVIDIDGPINSIMSSYVKRQIDRASQSASAIVLRIDTPGGLMDPMRDIVKKIMNCPIPVIGYVSPEGARAASAGVFILLACDYIAMTPTSNIGAAHPVMIGGKDIDQAMKEKIVNDTLAYIVSLAQKRGRNKEIVKKMVEESTSLTANEALDAHIIDSVARNIDKVIENVSGREIDKNGKKYIIKKNNTIFHITMNLLEKFLFTISNPNIAYILLSLGVLGIIAEFRSPGVGFPGVFGGLSFLLAMFGLNTLPVNIAGLLLIIFGVVLFILEISAQTHGILGIGSIVAFLIGSMILIRGSDPTIKISLYVIITTTVVLTGFLALITFFSIKTLLKKKRKGLDTLMGLSGYCKTDLSPRGTIFVNGEYWSAYAEENCKEGDKVHIIDINDMIVKVKKTVDDILNGGNT